MSNERFIPPSHTVSLGVDRNESDSPLKSRMERLERSGPGSRVSKPGAAGISTSKNKDRRWKTEEFSGDFSSFNFGKLGFPASPSGLAGTGSAAGGGNMSYITPAEMFTFEDGDGELEGIGELQLSSSQTESPQTPSYSGLKGGFLGAGGSLTSLPLKSKGVTYRSLQGGMDETSYDDLGGLSKFASAPVTISFFLLPPLVIVFLSSLFLLCLQLSSSNLLLLFSSKRCSLDSDSSRRRRTSYDKHVDHNSTSSSSS
jgi:hypothetical protein